MNMDGIFSFLIIVSLTIGTIFAGPIEVAKKEAATISTSEDSVLKSKNVPVLVPSASKTSDLKIPFKTVRVPVQIAESDGKKDINAVFVNRDELPVIWPPTLMDEANEAKIVHEANFLKDDGESSTDLNNASTSIHTVMEVEMRVGTIGVGTPSQKFDMLMSFASSQFWVYGSKRLVPYSEPFDKRVYNSSESETAKVTTKQIEFTEWVTVDGYHFHMKQASGRIVHETIQIGKNVVPNVSIGAIDDINWAFYDSEFKIPVDGQMGLMLTDETGTGRNKIPSPMVGLVAKTKKPLITIYQKQAKFEWEEAFLDGSLTIGSENSEECTAFTPAISYKVDKKFSLKGQPRIHAKSLKLSDGFDAAILDREVAIVEGLGIMLNRQEAVRIGRHLAPFGARRIQPGIYQIPCNSRGKLPSLRFEFAGSGCGGDSCSVAIDFNEYIINLRKKVCLLAVFANFRSSFENSPIVIGNGMFQGKCMALNVVDQTIAFANGV